MSPNQIVCCKHIVAEEAEMAWNIDKKNQLFSVLLLAVFICCFSTQAYSADTAPPTITAFDFTPKSVDVSSAAASISVTATLSDVSGFASSWNQVHFKSPTGTDYGAIFTVNTSGQASATVNIPANSAAGTYTLDFISTRDTVGNNKYYYTADLSALGFPTTLLVTSGTPTYTISSTVSGNGGGISCTPASVQQGQSSLCTITPANGYQLSSLTDNGSPVNATGGTYTISNVSANHSVMATFSIIPIIDTAAPVVLFSLPTTLPTLVVPVTFTASDNIGVTGYCLLTVNTASSCTWVSTAPSSYTFTTAGAKTLYAFAKDAANNISSVASATVTIDPAVPSLSVSSLSNGSITNNPTLNVNGTVTDVNGLQSLTVNGQIVTVGSNSTFNTAVALNEGANTIVIVATNIAGKQVTDTRTITLDSKAPLLAITTPADNSITNRTAVTISGTISENSTVTVSVAENSATQSAIITGNSFEATVNLIQGLNTITITATDLAGNVSQAKRTITSDALAPVLAITDPAQDIRVSAATYLLKGTVTDSATPATVAVSFEGQTFNPVITNGAFEQQLTFTTEKQYAVSVVASDQGGNSVTAQRNIIYSSSVDFPIYNGNAKLSCNTPVVMSASTACNVINNTYNCQISLNISSTSAQLAACRVIPAAGSGFINANGCAGGYSGNDFVTGSLATACTISGKLSGTLAQFTINGSVNGGNGTIACTSPVYAGNSSTCTITPASGYTLSSLTDNGVSVTSAVSAGVYSVGGSGLFSTGVNSDHQIVATFAPAPINGACGSSSGLTLAAAPTANFCTTGTASAVTGSGPWNWSCTGSNGGTDTACSANLQAPSIVRNGIITASPGKNAPDIGDALAVLKHVIGTTALSAPQRDAADVAPLGSDGKPRGNGVVDIADVIIILRRSIGIGTW